MGIERLHLTSRANAVHAVKGMGTILILTVAASTASAAAIAGPTVHAVMKAMLIVK